MAERIFVMDGDGNLEPMNEQAFQFEHMLQELIADYPELLAGEQMDPGNPRRWILITREKGIAESADTGHRWSIDHVFIDQDAVPTLVEAKRGSNTEIRRAIVGQLLEYAAHAMITWNMSDLRSIFEQRNPDDHDALIAQLLGLGEEVDEDAFWDDVETNLKAKNIRLLFVADDIPDSLTRIVEFLNEQMPRIEVLAVEIKQFKGETSQTLVPRVIGQLAARRSSGGVRSPQVQQTKEEFLDRFDNDSAREVAARLIEVAENTPMAYFVSSNRKKGRMGIQVNCPLWRNPVMLAWLSPPGDLDAFEAEANHFIFGMFQYYSFHEYPVELQERLQQWADSFKHEGKHIHPWGRNRDPEHAYAIPYADAVERIDTLVERLQSVINDLANLQSS